MTPGGPCVHAALHKEVDDFLTIAHHVLCGCGFVINVPGIDVSAVIEEEFASFHGAGEVERRLAVAAGGVDERGIGGEQRVQRSN